MSYATRAEMIDRHGERELIQLTDNGTPPSGVINDDVLSRALSDADGLINGYLASRYTLPIAAVPGVLSRVASDLARYFLAKRPTEEMVDRYDKAIAWLKDVASGKVSLGATTQSAEPPSTGGPQSSGNDRVFGPDTLGDY